MDNLSTKRIAIPEWFPYVLPMGLFLGITFLEGSFEKDYVTVYFIKMALVVLALIYAKATWKDIRWDPKVLPVAIVTGLVMFGMWVGIENTVNYSHMGERTGYNPWEKIEDDGLRSAFFAVRFFGLVLLVPFMEELFWRSFGLRYASVPDWQNQPVGFFIQTGAVMTCGIFALAHPEWLVALIFSIAMTVLIHRTKSVFACFVAHLVTNLALGIYVVTQHAWHFW
jgi:CAAX prenyl protease-like protein